LTSQTSLVHCTPKIKYEVEMPIYEYQCQECKERFDKFVRSISAEVEIVCPNCGSKQVRKGFSLFASKGGSAKSTAALSASACAPSG